MDYNYAVIVVTYNRIDLLRECLKHILGQTAKPGNVVVIDNASTDGTGRYLDDCYGQDELFTIIHSKENMGGAGGFSAGLEAAMHTDSDWFMLIDDDAILHYDCMENLTPDISNKEIMAYACTVMTNGRIQENHRKDSGGPVKADRYNAKEILCSDASFCGLMVCRSLVEKIGYPEKRYFIRFDDMEYSLRIIRYSGILIRTEAGLDHKTVTEKPWSIRNVADWKKYYGVRNTIHAYKKHKKIIMLIRALMKYTAIMVVKMFMSVYDRRYAGEIILYRDAIADGIRGRLGKNPRYAI